MSIKEVTDALLASAILPEDTVDGLEASGGEGELTGIAVAFMPTYSVIQQTLRLGANLLIAHEGLGYRHRPLPELLQHDPVYRQKMQLITDAGLSVFRLHDAVHHCVPDLITDGLVQALGWKSCITKSLPEYSLAEVAGMTLQEIASHVKACLGLPELRVIGDMSMVCQKIGVTVGYRGGEANCIPLLQEQDLIIVGEGPEWETPEYVRDAVQQGRNKALIVLGHGPSEEPGMKLLAASLQAKVPGVPVEFISTGALFHTL